MRAFARYRADRHIAKNQWAGCALAISVCLGVVSGFRQDVIRSFEVKAGLGQGEVVQPLRDQGHVEEHDRGHIFQGGDAIARRIGASGSTAAEYEANLKRNLENFRRENLNSNSRNSTSSLIEGSTQRAVTALFADAKWAPMLGPQGEFMGGGADGQVYIAKTTCGVDDNVWAAFKTYPDPRKFRQSEVAAMQAFDNPYVIRFYGVGKTAKQKKNVVMMEGGRGNELYKQYDRLTKPEMTKALLEVMVALKYVHSKGYMHGDLKPEQFIFSETCEEHPCWNRVLKLTDFGYSHKVDKGHHKGLSGSMLFIDPEVWRKHEVTQSSDIWSMGVVIYTMAKRNPREKERLPWFMNGIADDDLERRLAAIDSNMIPGNADFLNNVRNPIKKPLHPINPKSEALDKLIAGCLKFPSKDRFTATTLLEQAIIWAKSEGGLTPESVDNILNAKDVRSSKLPACWPLCIQKACKGTKCWESSSQAWADVTCGAERPSSFHSDKDLASFLSGTWTTTTGKYAKRSYEIEIKAGKLTLRIIKVGTWSTKAKVNADFDLGHIGDYMTHDEENRPKCFEPKVTYSSNVWNPLSSKSKTFEMKVSMCPTGFEPKQLYVKESMEGKNAAEAVREAMVTEGATFQAQ